MKHLIFTLACHSVTYVTFFHKDIFCRFVFHHPNYQYFLSKAYKLGLTTVFRAEAMLEGAKNVILIKIGHDV